MLRPQAAPGEAWDAATSSLERRSASLLHHHLNVGWLLSLLPVEMTYSMEARNKSGNLDSLCYGCHLSHSPIMKHSCLSGVRVDTGSGIHGLSYLFQAKKLAMNTTMK
jgi:hypothetical protein